MTWRPILKADDLLDVHEKGTFDAKFGYFHPERETRRDEMAKDAAAFASAMGGTLLLGAEEQAGRVSAFKSVTDAKAVQEEFARAIQTRCVPAPSLDDRIVELSPDQQDRLLGKHGAIEAVRLLAINVFPMPSGPVGVRALRHGQHLFTFPIRVFDQTDYLDPIRVSLLANPHDRKIALQLQEVLSSSDAPTVRFPESYPPGGDPIPGCIGRRLHVFDRARREGSSPRQVVLKTFDVRYSVAIFTPDRLDSLEEANVPLVFIQAIWRDPQRGWSVALDGSLFRSPITGGHAIPFVPPGVS